MNEGFTVWSLGFAALNEGVKVSGFRGYGGVQNPDIQPPVESGIRNLIKALGH